MSEVILLEIADTLQGLVSAVDGLAPKSIVSTPEIVDWTVAFEPYSSYGEEHYIIDYGNYVQARVQGFLQKQSAGGFSSGMELGKIAPAYAPATRMQFMAMTEASNGYGAPSRLYYQTGDRTLRWTVCQNVMYNEIQPWLLLDISWFIEAE